MKMKRSLSSLLTTLGVLFLFPALARAAQFTPLEWQQEVMQHRRPEVVGQRKHLYWVRDQNVNFIDDEIERRFRPGDKVDVVVELNTCLKPEEIEALASEYGSIGYVGKLITYVMVEQVRFERLESLAADPRVAMVEWQAPGQLMNDVSTRAVQARASNTYRGNSAEDRGCAGDRGCTGAGVNVAIVDSGVDDAHESLAGKFVAGFDATNFFDRNANGVDDSCEPAPLGNGVCTDPDDEPADGTTNPPDYFGHGTHVAGIAVGAGGPRRECSRPDDGSPTNCAGVARDAGLIDVKSCLPPPFDECPPADVSEALDWVAINAARFHIRVVNVSIGYPVQDDGTSGLAQQINYLAALGVNVVVAHGNASNFRVRPGTVLTTTFASASFAVTVSGTNDRNTVTRSDDGLYSDYLRGPRSDFPVSSDPLALKPDISAPGENIVSAARGTTSMYVLKSGTSMAAPHVAGAAAILLQARPDLDPGSLKDLLKRSADASRNDDPRAWDSARGAGMLNVWAALSAATSADVKFPNCVGPGTTVGQPCALTSPLPAWDNTLDISTATPPRVRVANTITAQVRNEGAVDAVVLVNFGVYVFAVGNSQFFHIGTQRVTVPALTTITVSQPWTPASSNHQCIQVSIDFGLDTNSSNNVTQRNFSVAASVYEVRVENPLMTPAHFRVEARSEREGWVCRVNEEEFTLDPFRDCPRQLRVTFDAPRGTPPGEHADCNVAVYATPEGDKKPRLIGGVTVQTFVPKPCQAEGVVLDAMGKPVRAARVEFEKEAETQAQEPAMQAKPAPMPKAGRPPVVYTDSSGRFSATLAGEVTYRVQVSKTGAGDGKLLVQFVCGKPLTLVLGKGGLTQVSK
jgi:subtilisin family serine protease